MPRQLERTINVDCPDDVAFELAQQALVNIGLRVRELDDASREIRATKGLSIMSYGHNVVIRVEAGGASAWAKTAVTISSKVKFPQMVDYGTNEKLINQFSSQLRHLVATSDRDRIVERDAHRPNI